MTGRADPFAPARAVADTVLFEGYVLYPYRASAAKNRLRWQFGVLAPPGWAAEHGEASSSRTECLVDPGRADVVTGELRFLHVTHRSVERADGAGFAPADRLDDGTAVHVPWDEGVTGQVTFEHPLSALLDAPVERVVDVRGTYASEPVRTQDGAFLGRLLRESVPLRVRLRISASRLDGPYGTVRLAVTVANDTAGIDPGLPREDALRSSLVATHLLLHVSPGAFLSLAAPPEWARPAAAGCVNEHTWPVLVGGSGSAPVVLSSPIILDDDPTVAPESATALYDATEIDEILTLRTMTLTDEEKREARGTDPRAAAVVDAVDALPPEVLDRLHGAIRSLRAVPTVTTPAAESAPPLQPWWDPGADASVDPEHDSVLVRGVAVARGSRVVLRPGVRGADAQDLFLDGRTATVHAVLGDVDGGTHVAVAIDGDPLADLQAAHGRYRYFRPDELEPLPGDAP